MSSTPRLILNGIRDVSLRVPVAVPEALPQNLSLIFILAERGDSELFVGSDVAAIRQYGSATFEYNSPFYTHTTALSKVFTREGNAVMYRRMIPAGARKAILRLSVELMPAQVPNYQRDMQTGEVLYQGSGSNRTPLLGTPAMVNGYRAIFHLGTDQYGTNGESFGSAQPLTSFRNGSATNSLNEVLGGIKDAQGDDVSVTSTLYPILDLPIASEGSYGNRVGLRMRIPTVGGQVALDQTLMNAVESYPYQFGIVEKSASGLTSNIQETVLGEDYVLAVLRDTAVNPRTNTSLAFADRIIDDWSYNEPGYTPIAPVFGGVHVYTASIDTLLNRLTQGETIGGAVIPGEGSYDGVSIWRDAHEKYSDASKIHRFNFFTGQDLNGVPYHALDTSQSIAFGGIGIGNDNVFYAEGGDDGLPMSMGAPDRLAIAGLLDQMVRDELTEFGQGTIHYQNMPRYPLSTIWDSGFSMRTKEAMLVPLGVRKDIAVILSTHSVVDSAESGGVESFEWGTVNTESTEQSRAATLTQKALLFPESIIDGTPCCRAMVIGHSGELLGEPGKQVLPMLFDFAQKVARYMGASNGRWNPQRRFDEGESKIVTLMRNVNLTSKTAAAYDQSWTNGLVWVQHWDRRRFFYNNFQTVYPDATSILNTFVNMMACVQLEKIAFRIWASLTGTTMSDSQLIETSDRMLRDAIVDLFDGRVRIEPETYLTPADIASGNSWSARFHVYGNVAKGPATTTIVTHRASELTAN